MQANTKEFLSLPEKERVKQVNEKIKLENKKLYEDVKRNISKKYADISWSYHKIYYNTWEKLKDLENKPRHINFININYEPQYDDFGEFQVLNFHDVPQYNALSDYENIIVFADENIDHKHEFAAWGWYSTLDYSDNETSINFNWSQRYRNRCEACSRDIIWESQPKFAIIVHDGNLENFSQPKEALNLIEDDNLQTEEVEKISKSIRNNKKCNIL